MVLKLGPDESDFQKKKTKRSNRSPVFNRSLLRVQRILNDLSQTDLLAEIRSITVTKFYGRGPTLEDNGTDWLNEQLDLVYKIVSQASKLARLRFELRVPIPLALLELLEKHRPSVRLELLYWTRAGPNVPADDPLEKALARSPCLDTIGLGIFSPSYGTTKASFSRIIQSTPSLRCFRLNSLVNSLHSLVYSSEPRVLDKFYVQAPFFKALEELKLRNTDISNFPYDFYWSSFIDFSRLETLDIAMSRVKLSLPQLAADNPFQNLRRLSIDFYHRTTSMLHFHSFLNACQLHSLAIFPDPIVPEDLLDFLNSQAPTLRFLLLGYEPSSSELIHIRETCPSLDFLAVQQYSPYAPSLKVRPLYAILATFSQLECVRIEYPTYLVNEWRSDTEKKVRKKLVAQPFQKLASAKVGKPLQKLAVEVRCGWRCEHGRPTYRSWVAEEQQGSASGQRIKIHDDCDLVAFKSASHSSFPDLNKRYEIKRLRWK